MRHRVDQAPCESQKQLLKPITPPSPGAISQPETTSREETEPNKEWSLAKSHEQKSKEKQTEPLTEVTLTLTSLLDPILWAWFFHLLR